MKSAQSTNYASITSSIASEVSAKLETNTFILGNILKAGDNIRINAQLVEAGTEEIYKTYQVELKKEEDIFMMKFIIPLPGLGFRLNVTNFVENYDRFHYTNRTI